MRLRTRIALILLVVALAPLAVTRLMDLSALERLGRSLADQVGNSLVHQASVGLGRIISDHTRRLAAEQRILEMAVSAQAEALALAFVPDRAGGRAPVTEALAIPPAATGPLAEMERQARSAVAGEGNGPPLTMRLEFPPGECASAFDPQALDRMGRALARIRREAPELILWQLAALPGGGVARLPAPAGRDAATPEDSAVLSAGNAIHKGPRWSGPLVDPFSGRLVLALAAPVDGPPGSPRATALVVPLDALFMVGDAVGDISGQARGFLVRLGHGPEGVATPVARQASGGGWEPAAHDAAFPTSALDELAMAARDLDQGRTGVRSMPINGVSSLVAYGPVRGLNLGLMVAVPTADLLAEAGRTRGLVHTMIGKRNLAAFLTMLAVAACVVGLSVLLARAVTRPILSVVASVKRVARGDFTARADTSGSWAGGGEIGELGRAVNEMIPALEERLCMQRDLALATHVQQNLLPTAPPSLPGLEAAGATLYCDETGGDFHDFVPDCFGNPGSLGLMVGDVSGHGLQASLLMATVRSAVRTRAQLPGDPAVLAADVSRLTASDTFETAQFATLFFLQADPSRKRLVWTRAGHDPGLLFDPASDCFTSLNQGGPALGIAPEAEYGLGRLEGFDRGQVVVLFTDGLWEALGADGEMYGKERVKEVVRRAAGESAQGIVDAVMKDFGVFTRGVGVVDDVTVGVVKAVG